MSPRKDALAQIVALANDHAITAKEIAQALNASTPLEKGTNAAVKVFGYLGGIFILSGIAAYTGMFWEEMDSVMRIAITLGSGVICYILAFISLGVQRYEKLATPFFLLAALLQPLGLFVAIEELSFVADSHIAGLAVFGFMLVQQAMTFSVKRRTTLLFMTIWFAVSFLATLFDYFQLDPELISLVLGLIVLCVSYKISNSSHHAIAPFWFFLSSCAFLWSVFDYLEGTPIEVLYAAVSCAFIYLSTTVNSRTLLLTGTVSLLGYIGYFTADNFVDSVGWPIALVVLGIAFSAVSSFSFRIGQKYIERNGSR